MNTALKGYVTDDLVNDAHERCGGVDDDAVFRYSFFRLMQARNEFSFLWSPAPVSWVQCHSLINPPKTGVKVDIKDKHAVK
ncbi:hypothetical protein KSX_04630 [Ktedonospora formicarum]|uniref:Uncharacterized protein n=1 Tax=Ktedonospora formicarum TaxID=2778364 RepID=A0A8J3HWH2_9CHLR|nr:hypothetical protein [Ktedonospora formicarum]GHO42300.1 hypothetical protein KSX_04630 [Ktedonospora formicarum]